MKAGEMRTPKLCKARSSARVAYKGQWIYLGKWDSAEANARYHQVCSAIATGADPLAVAADWSDKYQKPLGETGTTVCQLADKWRASRESHYQSPTGQSAGKVYTLRMVAERMSDRFRSLHAKLFRPHHLVDFQAELANAGLSRTYVREIINMVRACFRWGVTMDIVPVEVWQSLLAVEHLPARKTAAAEPRKVESVAIERVNATLPHVSPTVQNLVLFQLLTGCRPSEAIHSQWSEIDRHGPKGCWVYRPEHHKTMSKGQIREIAIGPKCQAMLNLLGTNQYVFGEDAPPMTVASYRQAIVKGCERAFDCPKELRTRKYSRPEHLRQEAAEWRAQHCWFPYQLRHLAGTEIARAADLEHVAAVLGHASTDTSRIYVDHSEALVKAASVVAVSG